MLQEKYELCNLNKISIKTHNYSNSVKICTHCIVYWRPESIHDHNFHNPLSTESTEYSWSLHTLYS